MAPSCNTVSARTWARYALDSAHCHSKCGENCCEIEIDAHEIEIASGSEEDGVRANVCCF